MARNLQQANARLLQNGTPRLRDSERRSFMAFRPRHDGKPRTQATASSFCPPCAGPPLINTHPSLRCHRGPNPPLTHPPPPCFVPTSRMAPLLLIRGVAPANSKVMYGEPRARSVEKCPWLSVSCWRVTVRLSYLSKAPEETVHGREQPSSSSGLFGHLA